MSAITGSYPAICRSSPSWPVVCFRRGHGADPGLRFAPDRFGRHRQPAGRRRARGLCPCGACHAQRRSGPAADRAGQPDMGIACRLAGGFAAGNRSQPGPGSCRGRGADPSFPARRPFTWFWVSSSGWYRCWAGPRPVCCFTTNSIRWPYNRPPSPCPGSDTLFWFIPSSAVPAGFGTGLMGGVLAGQLPQRGVARRAATGLVRKPGADWPLHAWRGLMGVGGVLAGGCTVGAGLSGSAMLSIAALMALASIVLGAALTSRALRRTPMLQPAE